MVVAAGAADRQAEEDQARRLGDVVERVLPPQPLVVQVDHVGIAAVEPGGDEGGRVVGGDLVAGELEPDEPVVGHVAVQGVDDPVAIPPGVGPGLVELEAVGVGVARQVEPVLRPAHAVLRAGQQAVDDLLIGVGRAVVQERLDLLGRRRQAGQVEAEAAEQRRAVGLGRGRQAVGLEARQDEGVDRVADPAAILDGRRLGPPRRPERPVVALLGGDRLVRDLGVVGRGEGGQAKDHRHRAAERHGAWAASSSRDIAPVALAQIFSTTRSPYGASDRSRAVEDQADLIDDAGQAEQVLRVRHRDIRIAQEVAREDVLGRVHPDDAGSEQPAADLLAAKRQPAHRSLRDRQVPDPSHPMPAWSSSPCRNRPGRRTVSQVP